MSTYVLLTFISVALRWFVSLHDYSGARKPPMFGDYEAQRHWMEITYNLPVKEWYTNTTNNDLQYWGLDYPPLTAYHSWLCGLVAYKINSDWVSLFTSRGFESYAHKLFMRYSVLLVDLFIFFPAVFLFYSLKKIPHSVQLKYSLVMLLYPGFLLIDYGHFQYNCVSLGLTLLGVVSVSQGYHVLGSSAFTLALNYKQMSLYHAIPFFCFLLGWCLQNGRRGIIQLLKIAVTVILTFVVCWLPFLTDKATVMQVLHRIFPVARGLYEDKVANVWCSLSVVIKIKQLLTTDQVVVLCLVTTLLFLLPSSIHLLIHPTVRNFETALINSSLVFFLFSFHVHEKSILLPALAVSLKLHERPLWCVWFYIISTFSMLPLLIKDGLLLASIATTVLHYIICSCIIPFPKDYKSHWRESILVYAFRASMTGAVCLTIISVVMEPPLRYPDLFPVLISIYSCVHFVLFLLVFHLHQFQIYVKDIKTKQQ